MPVKCISIPWHPGASLPSTCPAPAWHLPYPSWSPTVKGALCVDLSRARQRLLGDQGSGLLLLPLPQNTGPATALDCLPSWERGKQTRLACRGGREAVCAFGSWKRGKCAGPGSKVGRRRGHVEPMRGGSFLTHCTGTRQFTVLSRGPTTEPPGPPQSPHKPRWP